MRISTSAFTWLAVFALLAGSGTARAFEWAVSASPPCEPPEIYYSAAHTAGVAPCCTRNPERCPGGVACIAGSCDAPYGSFTCSAPAGTDTPNILFFLTDDQGYCHYGFSGTECRSERYGFFAPVPATPNMDALVADGKGRFFTINYSNAAWSLPARETIQMGLLGKDILDPAVPDRFIAQILKDGSGSPYCSFGAGGKLGGSRSEDQLGFDAFNKKRKWGRYLCLSPACFPNCDDPPVCGADIDPSEVPDNVNDVFEFVASTLIGPRDGEGKLIPGTTYTQGQPLFLFISSSLPHKPYKPPVAIEDPFHLLDDYLFGESFASPGTPRFPFGAPQYAEVFDRLIEKYMAGYYGNVWWVDDNLRVLREFLESVMVWDHTGTTAVSLWDRTVYLQTGDHGINMPRAKRNFTENGYRNPLILHDGRLTTGTTLPPRIEEELTHTIDILPTIVDYAGHTAPPGPGYSMKAYLTATPPSSPIRNTMCGHQTKGTKARTDRYIRVRPGAVGRCAPASGTACTTDAECAPDKCLAGTCGSAVRCMENGDCPAGETCQHKTQRWCRFSGHPLTEANPLNPASPIAPADQQATVTCTTDADCQVSPGCLAADPIHCTCEMQEMKYYVDQKGEARLMDLFVDPDERGMDRKQRKLGAQAGINPLPGDLPHGPGDPHEPLARRLRCCLDRWWSPPPTKRGIVLGDPSCSDCEAQYACHRCGDGIADSDEACDGAHLAGATCASLGFGGGTLACSGACAFDTSGCTP